MQKRWNTVNPLGHVGIAAGGEHDDRVLVDCTDLPDEFVLSARQLEGSVRAFAFRLRIKANANDHGVRLRSERFGLAANGRFGLSHAEANDGAAHRLEILEAKLVRVAGFQMCDIAVYGLGMALPVIDHGIVAEVEPNSIIR